MHLQFGLQFRLIIQTANAYYLVKIEAFYVKLEAVLYRITSCSPISVIDIKTL